MSWSVLAYQEAVCPRGPRPGVSSRVSAQPPWQTLRVCVVRRILWLVVCVRMDSVVPCFPLVHFLLFGCISFLFHLLVLGVIIGT